MNATIVPNKVLFNFQSYMANQDWSAISNIPIDPQTVIAFLVIALGYHAIVYCMSINADITNPLALREALTKLIYSTINPSTNPPEQVTQNLLSGLNNSLKNIDVVRSELFPLLTQQGINPYIPVTLPNGFSSSIHNFIEVYVKATKALVEGDLLPSSTDGGLPIRRISTGTVMTSNELLWVLKILKQALLDPNHPTHLILNNYINETTLALSNINNFYSLYSVNCINTTSILQFLSRPPY